MPQTRANLILATLGCAFALAAAGCIAPWSAPPAAHSAAKGTPSNTAASGGAGPTNAPPDQGVAQPDMTGVLDKIQQVRAMDPAAEPRLLDELRRAPPSSWPLVAEQFRATLAFHEQLVESGRSGPRPAQPVVDLRRAPPASAMSPAQTRQVLATGLAYDQSAAPIDGRPSGSIGSLPDPHGSSSDMVPVLTRSMPYALPSPIGQVAASRSEPAPPAPFASDGRAYPIDGHNTDDASATADGSAGDRQKSASQVGAQMIAKPSKKRALMDDDQGGTPTGARSKSSSAAEDDWHQDIQRAITDLEHRVSSSPTTTAEVHQHVSLRMLRLLAGNTEAALEPIPHVSPTEQDYWSRQLFALATYMDHHGQPDDKRRAAASVTHLDEAVSQLRELGSLSLRNLSFCKNVYGYGAIETYDSDTFTPAQHVSLYVEVENYHSTSSEKGFCTSLGTTYEILDEKGKRVTSGDFPDVNDCCRNRRRDFHIQFGLTLPENLSPGRYQLQLVVKDRQSDKIGNAKASFEVRAGRR